MNFKFWYSLKIPFIVIFKKKRKENKQTTRNEKHLNNCSCYKCLDWDHIPNCYSSKDALVLGMEEQPVFNFVQLLTASFCLCASWLCLSRKPQFFINRNCFLCHPLLFSLLIIIVTSALLFFLHCDY